ncbi:sigma-70 family RNA polymerase sigma factor [Allorhodopirellula heiligendammensis]|uniref:RNA polymerase sigma factor SigM n=1 Tax=Allorhodopirellula heiligendammensis TaxID=2714739 RepID=A0A5C6BF66_9BACT|nr:sigma-70 family RNA polymerase sigma factor [Allorhodopirellula heiligendammensis]TWU10550.1 RNA polymerase sigma factor SigM [Allorhodopirellula heiligendammensis]
MKQTAKRLPSPPADASMWVDEFGDSLYRYALSRLRDPEAAEDVVQQTFLAGLEHHDQFSGVGSRQGWLMGILKRKIIDFIRQRNRVSPLDGLEVPDPWDSFFDRNGSWKKNVRETLLEPLDAVDRKEFWPIFQTCLGNLPQRQAGAFMLREVEGLESAEICKELEISASNLWVLLHRARLRLANCIKTRWLQENE